MQERKFSVVLMMAALVLLTFGAVINFYHLSHSGLTSEPSARLASYARQLSVQEQGGWLAPVFGDQVKADVPPLTLWAVKLCAGFEQEYGARPTRLPGAISALLLVMLVSWWSYRHSHRYERDDETGSYPEGFGLLAGLLLVTCPVTMWAARSGSSQALLTLLATGAAYCLSESLEARRSFYSGTSWRVWMMWAWVLTGLAMLTQGPIAFLMIMVPYFLATQSYHLRRPDWIHVPGLAVALVLGVGWPVWVSVKYPQADVWSAWLTLRAGAGIMPPLSMAAFVAVVVLSTLPWLPLTAAMVCRVFQRQDRSPSLVFWSWSLLANFVLLALLSSRAGAFVLPVAIYICLLASQALARWNFENQWAKAWRWFMRPVQILAIALGIFMSALLHSELGVLLMVVISVWWFTWSVRSRTHGIVYTRWETTVRLASIAVVIIAAALVVVVTEWIPRQRFQNTTLAYYSRVERILDKHASPDAALVFDGQDRSGLYDYYLPHLPSVKALGRDGEKALAPGTFLFARATAAELMTSPRLRLLTANPQPPQGEPSDAMFLVLGDDQLTSPAQAGPSCRVAVVGNAGRRNRDERDVGGKLSKEGRLDHVLTLGNNLYGPTIWNHLDFVKAFERPFKDVLKKGVLFHALLGHEDQSYAWLQTHYPPFNMYGRRYYKLSMAQGLVDCFMLDSERLDSAVSDDPQLAWLGEQLAASQASWKVVALHRALYSSARNTSADPELLGRLAPLLRQYNVDVVLAAGGHCYERIELQDLPGATLFNVGLSGGAEHARFREDACARVQYDDEAGFLVLEFGPREAQVRCVDRRGKVFDTARLTPVAAASQPQP